MQGISRASYCTERLNRRLGPAARGLFRGDCSPVLTNQIARRGPLVPDRATRPLCRATSGTACHPPWPRSSARGLFCRAAHRGTLLLAAGPGWFESGGAGPGWNMVGAFFHACTFACRTGKWLARATPKRGRGVMSNKQVQPASECQACRGTGYVAGALPIKTGPYVLEPPPCRVCGGTGRMPQPRE